MLGDTIHKTGKVQDREAGQGSAPARPEWMMSCYQIVWREKRKCDAFCIQLLFYYNCNGKLTPFGANQMMVVSPELPAPARMGCVV